MRLRGVGHVGYVRSEKGDDHTIQFTIDKYTIVGLALWY